MGFAAGGFQLFLALFDQGITLFLGVLIDCMPSLGMMPINSLAAADSVIIPSQPSYLSAKGLDLLMQSIAKVKRQINPKLKIDGILFTMVDSRTNEAKEIIASLRAHYGEKIRVSRTKFYGRVLRNACINGSSELMTNLSMSLVNILYNYQLLRFAGE